jgi:predicted N-acetyltransferase YhbS
MDNLTLREATVNNAPAVLALIHAAFKEYDGTIDPPSGAQRETVDKICQKIATEHAVVAQVDDQVVACVFYRNEGDYMYFGRLAVLPAYRSRGIAGALIESVEARARELRLPRVRLGVRVALPNLRARYERLGYRMIEQRMHEGYAEPTYLIMEKGLNEGVRG